MGALDILGRLAEAGVRLSARGDKILADPANRLTDELRALIRANKPSLLALLSGPLLPLSGDERAALEHLARAWGMDKHDRAVMLRQCESGGELCEGSRISPDEARSFWLTEAGSIH